MKRSTSEPSELEFCNLSSSLQDLVQNFDQQVLVLHQNDPERLTFACQHPWQCYMQLPNEVPIKSQQHYNDDHDSIKMVDEDASSCPSVASTQESCMTCDRNAPCADHPAASDDEELMLEDPESTLSSSSKLPTADEVITEIDQIMSMSNSVGMLLNSSYMSSDDALSLRDAAFTACPKVLQTLSVDCLRLYVENLQRDINHLNEILVQELNIREEWEYQKEIKDEFISLINNVQRLKRELMKKKKDIECPHTRSRKRWSWTGLRSSFGAYSSINLNENSDKNVTQRKFIGVMIPYQASSMTLDVRILLLFNKLLRAIIDDTPDVSEILTEYILKDYLPASTTSFPIQEEEIMA